MSDYVPPLEDISFALESVLQAPAAWAALPAYAELDAPTAREIVAHAASFASETLAPLNGTGDLEGCHWSGGSVATPAGFAAAWQSFVSAGWPALACARESGGQGLPQVLNAAVLEMAVSANHAWSMYPGILHGAYEVLRKHAAPAIRERYLGKIVSGEWLATMALTEPQAGSDLALLRTRAEAAAPGPVASGDAVRVTGGKIFISGGDHDLTENIVHLVLARLPDAPAGTRGLSLVLVPKLLPDGSRNAVHCDGIETKMGLKGSATCQLRFEAAQGWLVGGAHAGLAAMFLMMNAARLHVGIQGLGHLEAAGQRARAQADARAEAARRSRRISRGGPDCLASGGPAQAPFSRRPHSSRPGVGLLDRLSAG